MKLEGRGPPNLPKRFFDSLAGSGDFIPRPGFVCRKHLPLPSFPGKILAACSRSCGLWGGKQRKMPWNCKAATPKPPKGYPQSLPGLGIKSSHRPLFHIGAITCFLGAVSDGHAIPSAIARHEPGKRKRGYHSKKLLLFVRFSGINPKIRERIRKLLYRIVDFLKKIL